MCGALFCYGDNPDSAHEARARSPKYKVPTSFLGHALRIIARRGSCCSVLYEVDSFGMLGVIADK